MYLIKTYVLRLLDYRWVTNLKMLFCLPLCMFLSNLNWYVCHNLPTDFRSLNTCHSTDGLIDETTILALNLK